MARITLSTNETGQVIATAQVKAGEHKADDRTATLTAIFDDDTAVKEFAARCLFDDWGNATRITSGITETQKVDRLARRKKAREEGETLYFSQGAFNGRPASPAAQVAGILADERKKAELRKALLALGMSDTEVNKHLS